MNHEIYLFEKIREMELVDWLWVAGAFVVLIAAIVGAVLLGKRKTDGKAAFDTHTMILGAMCLSLSFVLSYVKIVQMPMGGSITLASMLPLMWYSNRYGVKAGLLLGLAYGLLQFIQKPEIYHWAQIIIDYPLAFSMIGLAGCVKNLQLGCLIGGAGRLACHVVSGAIFFGSWAPEGMNAWVYSVAYNGAYLGVDTAICIVLSIPLMFILKKRGIGRTEKAA
ncbi:MAG TPA: energy-coupled thiamine transporter ThiT [Eubacteriales bacterium]|nr:energy-coupled thiamine transporter ThiT [Clostridia bacterium]HRV73669.1 energy-coupled thiamine transporter ThiT [Eubacteriales bacterium]